MKMYVAAGIIAVAVLVVAFFYMRPELVQEPIECTTDSECAPAGCSSQICTTASKAPSVITTCEMREEYACLKQTSCGCVKNKCAWKDTIEYRQCLDGLK